MRIVLCVTPAFHSETPPLGLAYLKASLIEHGHAVLCLDFSKGYDHLSYPVGPSRDIESGFGENSQVVESWVDKIERLKPDIVGISLWVSTKNTACLLASALKRRMPGVVVLGGGPDFLESDKEEYLDRFDYIVSNEGERVICEFADEIQRTGAAAQTKGIWFKQGEKIGSTGPAERIEDLDGLPVPDFSDFDLSSYSEGLPVMFSRGCSANCTFCTNKKYFANQVSRSGQGMFEEIRTHVERTDCRRFVFSDDSLLSPKNLDAFMVFCDRAIKSKLGFQWRIYAQRITPSVKKKHVKKMKKAGLVRVTFGVESFSDRIRRDMGKVVSDSITDRVLKEFVDQGIKVSLLLIYGYPIETDEDFDKTLAWVRKNGRRFSHICFSCFVVTNEYCEKRPGIVTFEEEGWHPYKWHSEIVGREKRIERFLKLVDVLADLDVEFMISDPHVNRYYREWNETTKKEFESEFNRSHENSPEESK